MVAPLAYAFGLAYVIANPTSLRLPTATVGTVPSRASIPPEGAAVEVTGRGPSRRAGPRRRTITPSQSAVAKTAAPPR